ncbi:MAG: LPXTG cell wall anchor domain-containing protein [Firmicutes bacterium]|nr:LPXTG cell wall anchor domain-containing protein [Bacillota bacterium]
MKKIKLVTILLLSLMFILGTSQIIFADSKPPVDGGTYTFDGNSITKTAGDETISDLEPGDDLTIDFTYTNNSSDTTYWYMENEIIHTLEDYGAANGGYTYTLTNSGPDGDTVIFDSDRVGGDEDNSSSSEAASQGLKTATESTDEWFFIQELGAGESGHTKIFIALDGESQANSYKGKHGDLRVNYAVEKQAPGEDIIINNPGTSTKTGDTFNPLLALLALTAAILAMLLAVLSYRKDRKDGEEA